MPPQDDYYKAMNYQCPDFIPVDVGMLPAAWMKYRGELDALVRRHPIIFRNYNGRDYDSVWSATYHEGEHTDDWGCVWSNIHEGVEAIVTGHPAPTRGSVRQLKAPQSVRDGFEHGFMYLRLADLRGFEELMVDFAEDAPELQVLIDLVLKHNLRKLDKVLAGQKEKGTILYFGDDLGMQTCLPMGPEKWRKYLKPCFMEIYQRCRKAGHPVFMHTDGHCWEVIGDLVECGVNVINPQIRANGLDNIVKACKGKVCCRLDLDRQMFPFCTPRDIEQQIREAVMKLGSKEGGLWLLAEVGPDVPLENIEAICGALEKYRAYYRG